MKLKGKKLLVGAITVSAVSSPALAVSADSAYIFNTLLFLIGGFLVMWMAAGFAMLEAGLVRTKNVAEICVKNVSLYAIACIMWMLMGYNLMYSGVDGGYFGQFFSLWSPDDAATLVDGAKVDPTGYSAGSDFFFQMVFVATTASIVSGTVAERIKLFPFLAFTVVLAGLIYPIQGAWKWGGGWLDAAGFQDFAGSTLVHSTGGWAALVGALILGPRLGRFTKDGKIKPMPGSSMPLATLGTFILWLGWFGFNGASQLALGSLGDAISVSNIFVNTNMAAAGGAVSAMLVTKAVYKKVDLSMILNGALAGLVSITAEPLTPTPIIATAIGGVGGALVVFAVPFFDKLKIDDVVGAISVHLVCGIWGTLAVPLTNDAASLPAQLLGIGAIGAFVTISSTITWVALKATVGIRLDGEDEERGSDLAELGMEAYPEFGKGSQKF
ncbi:ammonium transporter [Kordiimonas sp. SCSIO 12603]|uniref:ammonium transporter n=1 Tax=Kordiimonas sp. SCSIO 12603 TaxID=2829596 RepID=UPI0021040194|nr:ammonium transporter [Kordiimonas sp. SCSIO 12603]UTW57393.1 ammonium transporter [Kordiimonas sp. SCSIO 12603]